MEQSDLHGRRLDDELERESETFTRGAPVESRSADESPAPNLDAPSLDEARARSELARHLRPSVFPAGPADIVECAREAHAPDELVERLRTLPPDTYENVAQVWEALGGHREHRPHPTPEPELASAERQDDAPATQVRETSRFGFRFDPWYRWAAIPFGVHPDNAHVEIVRLTDPPHVEITFGPWHVSTTVDNVAQATVTGPYAFVKTIGPPHVSLIDTGLTFATNHDRGVCIQFHETVVGLDPLHLVHHPSVTVTVADPNALVAALNQRDQRED